MLQPTATATLRYCQSHSTLQRKSPYVTARATLGGTRGGTRGGTAHLGQAEAEVVGVLHVPNYATAEVRDVVVVHGQHGRGIEATVIHHMPRAVAREGNLQAST